MRLFLLTPRRARERIPPGWLSFFFAAGGCSGLVQKGGTVKLEALKNGTAVVLREPTMEDVDRLRKFFLSLPPEDQKYLREDVTQKEIVERRIRQAELGDVRRLVAHLRRKEIELIHCHTSVDHLVAALARRLAGIPVPLVRTWYTPDGPARSGHRRALCP